MKDFQHIPENSINLQKGEIRNLCYSKTDRYLQIIKVMKEAIGLGLLQPTDEMYDALIWFLGKPSPLKHFHKLFVLSGELYPSIHSVLDLNEIENRCILKSTINGVNYSILKFISEESAIIKTEILEKEIGKYGYESRREENKVTVKIPDTSLPVLLKNLNYFPLFLVANNKTIDMYCGICKDSPTKKITEVFTYQKEEAGKLFGINFQYPKKRKTINKEYFFPKDIFETGDVPFSQLLMEDCPTERVTNVYQTLRKMQKFGLIDCLSDYHLSIFLEKYLNIPQKTIARYVYSCPNAEKIQTKIKSLD